MKTTGNLGMRPWHAENPFRSPDNGPWRAEMALTDGPMGRQAVFLFSDDFTHDVGLEISGDFEEGGKFAYAQSMAAWMNGALTHGRSARHDITSGLIALTTRLTAALAEQADEHPLVHQANHYLRTTALPSLTPDAPEQRSLSQRLASDDARLRALREAVCALHFDDSSDFKSALHAVINALDPELGEMVVRDSGAAYRQVLAAGDVQSKND